MRPSQCSGCSVEQKAGAEVSASLAAVQALKVLAGVHVSSERAQTDPAVLVRKETTGKIYIYVIV